MELLKNCQKYAYTYYSNLLLAAEKNIVETLFKYSEQARNNHDQRRYYEAMQQFRSHSNQMHDSFALSLEAGYQRFLQGEVASDVTRHVNVEELALVNSQRLEDDLAISVIVSKANSRYSEVLWKLNRRLAVLRSGTPVSDEDNPFAPAMVCAALQKAVHTLQIDDKTRLQIYKLLGKIFIIAFEKSLQRLDQQLLEKNILPNLKFLAANRQAVVPDEIPVLEEPDVIHESPSSVAHQQEMYDSIKALQATLGARTHTVGGVSFGNIATDGISPTETFSEMDYALALSAVQQSKELVHSLELHKPIAAEVVEKRVLEQLAKQGDHQARHKMTHDDADTVDLVGMIFRYILDDKNLSDVVKSLLSHLHTPYLKLALMDKTFITNYEHSARILVNSLADVGGRWVKDENDKTVLPKMRVVVETVLKGFIDDYTIFDRLLEDFQRFRENLEKRAKMVERRNAESQQGLERLELSRQQAEQEVLKRCEKGAVNQQAVALLKNPWTDFLVFNLLRHGDQSANWKAALKVIDSVVWSVQGNSAIDSKDDYLRRQKAFDETIKDGLLAMGYDKEASANLLSGLREAQQLAFNALIGGEQSVVAAPESSPLPGSNKIAAGLTPTAIERQRQQLSSSTEGDIELSLNRRKYSRIGARSEVVLSQEERLQMDTLSDIAFGTWFEIRDNEGVMTRLKLAWYSKVTSHYMFVNSAGVKQTVITRIELAQGMVSGAIKMINLERRSFMERALEAVLNKLRPK